MTGASIYVSANTGGEGSLSMVGGSPFTSGFDGPPVGSTNQVVPAGGYTGTSLSQLTRQNQASMQAQVGAPLINSANNIQANTGRMMTAAVDEFGALICRALAGIDILGLHPFGFMAGWADALDAQARQALGTAQAAQATAQTAVNAVNNQQQQKSSGGASVSVSPFPPGFSGSLGPGWSIGGTPGSAKWQTGQYGASLAAQAAKTAVAGFQYGLNSTVMLTDFHAASGVIGYGDPNSQACTTLIVRAAADMSSFIYVNCFVHAAYMGAGSFNPSTGAWTFNDWGSTNGSDFTLYGGDTLTLSVTSATGATFSRNGQAVLTHSDVSAVPVGPSNRSVGLLSQQVVDYWGNASVGWTMNSFTAADTASPPTLGTGWSICRGTVSPNVSMANGGGQWHRLWGVFDTVRVQSNSVKFADFPSGAVNIPTTGWWSVSMGANFGTTPLGAAGGFSVIPKGTSGTEQPVRWGTFYDTQGNASSGPQGYSFIASATAVLYLNAGDVLVPIVLIDAQTTYNLSISGNGSGSFTYFDGVFLGNN